MRSATRPRRLLPSLRYRDDPDEQPVGSALELDDLEPSGRSHPSNRSAREAQRLQKRLDKLESLAEREEMKFSHSIQFNAVPDWSNNYISYSNLKKLIYTLEKQIHSKPSDAPGDEENTALLGGQLDPDTTFKRMLDGELDKVCSFYRLKELEIFGELEQLFKDVENYKSDTAGIDMDEVIDSENRRKVTRSQSILLFHSGGKEGRQT
ncbi:putative transporter [Cyphellophora attinorum]|uniref:Putative transporter n=1 Tax=Cyphellophora attinorum TaxID=1664694 RepID=A0A0N1HEF4_9EURO|nr:putative transporter [Phialophora attinorum]KPI43353.1 putative transporter [Phialophora attinorum]